MPYYGYYYSDNYLYFMVAILACMVLSIYASHKVKSNFAKYDRIRTRTGTTGSTAVRRLLQANGVYGISIGKVSGELSDHYHPKKAIINLSDSTHDSASVAAVAVAAHEVGHVMQKQEGYWFYNLRTALVPVVNVGGGKLARLCPVWKSEDLYVGMWDDFKMKAIDRTNDDFWDRYDISGEMSIGAARGRKETVMGVLCADSRLKSA